MHIYFVRHGESEANLLREISNRGFWTSNGTPGKHALTASGREQTERLAAELLSDPGFQPATGPARVHLFTSPVVRAVQTAQILAAALGAAYEITDALREYDCGVIEGRADDEAWRMFDAATQAWLRGEHDACIPGGESVLDMQARFVPFIETLRSQYGQDQDRVVLVSHGGLYRHMLPVVLGNISADFAMSQPIPNAGLIVAEARPAALVCVGWCGVRLEATGQL